MIKASSGTGVVSPTATTRYEDKNFVDTTLPVWNYSILYDDDISAFQQGTNYTLYQKFGAKPLTVLDKEGYHFTVWAPNATKVSVVGDFNNWDLELHQLLPRWDNSGIWEGFIPAIAKGTPYKYRIHGLSRSCAHRRVARARGRAREAVHSP